MIVGVVVEWSAWKLWIWVGRLDFTEAKEGELGEVGVTRKGDFRD